jgi:hypothetical protein
MAQRGIQLPNLKIKIKEQSAVTDIKNMTQNIYNLFSKHSKQNVFVYLTFVTGNHKLMA